MSACPVGCGRNVAPAKLLCLPCWREVPDLIKRRVLDTWKAYTKSLGNSLTHTPEARKAARAAYQEARDEAIGSVS